MDLHLTDKVAVVTGAGKGIGLAVAAALAAEGAKVVPGSREPGEALAGLADVSPVLPVAVDLSTPDGPAALVERAVAAFGGVDILVNNVGATGAPRLDGFLSVTDDEWRQTLDLNLLSAVRATRAALPHLLGRGGGSIVNVASINARLPQTPVVDYSVAKAGLVNLTKGLAEEFGPRGVRVNAVSPGPVRTPLWEAKGGFGDTLAGAMGVDVEGFLEGFAAQAGITLGRMGRPEEIAALVLFLASERSGWITGADLVIDGGMLKTV